MPVEESGLVPWQPGAKVVGFYRLLSHSCLERTGGEKSPGPQQADSKVGLYRLLSHICERNG